MIARDKMELEKLLETLIGEIKELNSSLKNSNSKTFNNQPEKPKESEKFLFKDIYLNFCELKSLTDDHICPKASGGSNYRENIMKICETSNKSKKDKTRKVIVNDVAFSIISRTIRENQKIGTIKINSSNLTEEQSNFYQENDLIKKEVDAQEATFWFIDTEKERKRFEHFLNSFNNNFINK